MPTSNIYIYIYIYIHMNAHLNKLECRVKVHLFQYFNSNCETSVLNKLNAHRLKLFKSLVILIVMILSHI